MGDLAHDGLRKKAESLEAQLKETQATLAIYQQRTADLERERITYLESHANLVARHSPMAVLRASETSTRESRTLILMGAMQLLLFVGLLIEVALK